MKAENKKSDWIIPLNLTKFKNSLIVFLMSIILIFFLCGVLMIGLWSFVIFINFAKFYGMKVTWMLSAAFYSFLVVSYTWFFYWVLWKYASLLKEFELVK